MKWMKINPFLHQKIIIRIARQSIKIIDLAQFISYASRYLFQQIVIVIEAGARVSCYDSRGGDQVHSVMRSVFIYVHEGAQFEYIDQQDWADVAYEFTAMTIRAGANSTVNYQALYTGARYAKTIINLELYAEGANAQICVGSVAKGKSYHHFISKQHHIVSRTMSSCAVRSVAYDQAQTEYYGTIRIDKNAQHCQAYQKHKSLLLSKEASAYACPNLEISAHEVQCGHGSAVGQINEEYLFYLQCRGMTKKVAQRELVYAFFDELYSNNKLQIKRQGKIL